MTTDHEATIANLHRFILSMAERLAACSEVLGHLAERRSKHFYMEVNRMGHLVLTRRKGERVIMSGGITVTVEEMRGGRVRLSFTAPDEVKIWREELLHVAGNVRHAKDQRKGS